jgi:hypothetical protein
MLSPVSDSPQVNYFKTLPRYEIDCFLDLDRLRLKARQKVTFTNNTDVPVEELFFHIYPNRKYSPQEKDFLTKYAGYFKINPFPQGFQSGRLSVTSATEYGDSLSYSVQGNDGTILKVDLNSALSPGDTVKVELEFQLDIPQAWGRFGHFKGIIALYRWYPQLAVLDEEGWHNYPFYPYHQPYFSQASFYKLKIRLDEELVVAHTGTIKDSHPNSDGTKTLLIETEFPVRDFSMAVSANYKVFSLSQGEFRVNSYYLAGDQFYGKRAAEFALAAIKYYSRKFGKYPYKTFNIAPVYLGHGGNESSCIIFIDRRAYKLPKILIRYFDFLVSHETGHQWFFNMVGSDEYREAFMDEGINSYFTLRHLQEKYGTGPNVLVWPKWLKGFLPNLDFGQVGLDRYIYTLKNGLDRTVLGELAGFKEPSSIFSIAYSKGAAVVAMLEHLLGEETFDKIMLQYCREYRFRNAGLADFKRICQEQTGQELDWFFELWLTTDYYCDYAVRELKKGYMVLERRGDIRMPLDVRVIFQDGKTQDIHWDGRDRKEKFSFPGVPYLKSAALDPEDRLVEADEVNNFYPRSIYIKPVPLYLFAYELPVFLPRDSYNLIFGPSFGSPDVGIAANFQRPHDYIVYGLTGYDITSETVDSTIGINLNHLWGQQISLGLEAFDVRDQKEAGSEDLTGFKVFLRRELWPASYGLAQVNDHLTLYLLKNGELKNRLSSMLLENLTSFHYRKKDEAMVGANIFLSNFGPYFDPLFGYKLQMATEASGHFLGATENFYRGEVSFTKYTALLPRHNLAWRFKVGLGSPVDKWLFNLGGPDGLRGWRRKELQGSRAMLLNLEYRHLLLEDLNLSILDNIFNLDDIQAIGFFDIGKAGFRDFWDAGFKKDIGLGLRFHIDLGSFLDRLVMRLDFARPIDEDSQDWQVWIELGQAI